MDRKTHITALGMTERCQWCGTSHDFTCPRIKAIDYDQYGSIKRVEFHEPKPVVSASLIAGWFSQP